MLRGRAPRWPARPLRGAAAPSKESKEHTAAGAARTPGTAAVRPAALAGSLAAPPLPFADGSAAPAASARTLRKWSRHGGRERPGRAVTGNAGSARHTAPNCALDPLGKRFAPTAAQKGRGQSGLGSVYRVSTENADSLV